MENFTLSQKDDDNIQQEIHTQMTEVDYKGPTVLNSEAVLLQCGANTNLFVRNVK